MKRLLFFISVILLITSCDEKNINLYPSFKQSAKVFINNQGAVNENCFISSSEINKAIDDLDLDESGAIKSVNVEGIWIVVEKLSENTAQSVNLSISIRDWYEGEKYIIEDYPLDIPNTKTEIYLPTYLKRYGVDEVKNQLSSLIIDGALKDIQFNVVGMPFPNESVVHVELEIFVKGSVVFSQTL